MYYYGGLNAQRLQSVAVPSAARLHAVRSSDAQEGTDRAEEVPLGAEILTKAFLPADRRLFVLMLLRLGKQKCVYVCACLYLFQMW